MGFFTFFLLILSLWLSDYSWIFFSIFLYSKIQFNVMGFVSIHVKSSFSLVKRNENGSGCMKESTYCYFSNIKSYHDAVSFKVVPLFDLWSLWFGCYSVKRCPNAHFGSKMKQKPVKEQASHALVLFSSSSSELFL